MPSNVEAHRNSHEAFNRRDWRAAVERLAPDFTYTDHARGVTVKSPQQFLGWLEEWTTSISDAQLTEPMYYDAGDTTVCVFTGVGTNDGPIGPFPASNQRLSIQLCEVIHWFEGSAISGEVFYDQMGVLIQAGHVQPPPTQ